jgi:hypothetical protein
MEEIDWLKRHYKEAHDLMVEPFQKKVKFQDIKENLQTRFPQKSFNEVMINSFIRNAFPNCYTKRTGGTRQTHVFGIKCIGERSSDGHVNIEGNIMAKAILNEKIKHLEEKLKEMAVENEVLHQMVKEHQLEREQLFDELSQLVSPCMQYTMAQTH